MKKYLRRLNSYKLLSINSNQVVNSNYLRCKNKENQVLQKAINKLGPTNRKVNQFKVIKIIIKKV